MRRLLIPFAALVTAAVVAAGTAVPAAGLSIQSNPSSNLDGKVVLSPAAERISTVKSTGGEPVGPGMTITRPVLLQNRAKQATDFDLDIAQVVGSDAEDIVEIRHGVRQGAAAWADLETRTVRLKPGDVATINVTIKIPKAIKPGSKPFAVTATQRSAAVQTQGAGVTPIFRQVAIFIVDLPGDAPTKGTITNASIIAASDTLRQAGGRDSRIIPFYPGKQNMRYVLEYKNDGERLLTPEGRVEVRNIFGKVVHRYDVKRFTVYPEGEAGVQGDMKSLPSFGFFRASLEIESEAGKQEKKLGTFILAPWWMMMILLGLVLYAAYQVVRWWLDRRRIINELAMEELDGEGFDDELDEDFDRYDRTA